MSQSQEDIYFLSENEHELRGYISNLTTVEGETLKTYRKLLTEKL